MGAFSILTPTSLHPSCLLYLTSYIGDRVHFLKCMAFQCNGPIVYWWFPPMFIITLVLSPSSLIPHLVQALSRVSSIKGLVVCILGILDAGGHQGHVSVWQEQSSTGDAFNMQAPSSHRYGFPQKPVQEEERREHTALTDSSLHFKVLWCLFWKTSYVGYDDLALWRSVLEWILFVRSTACADEDKVN